MLRRCEGWMVLEYPSDVDWSLLTFTSIITVYHSPLASIADFGGVGLLKVEMNRWTPIIEEIDDQGKRAVSDFLSDIW